MGRVDLTSPLRSLAPSLDSSVLEVLAGTESSLGIGQIAKIARRGTRQGLSLALDRLVEHGVVDAHAANRGYLYRLNREHVLADAVVSACRARVTVLARLGEAAQALDPQPSHVSVFGSFARREAGPDSDIDLLVVLPEDAPVDDRWHEQMRDLGDQVLTWTGNRLEYLIFTYEELRAVVARDEPVVGSWVADSVTVLGVPIESIVRELASLGEGHHS
jgi:hypothetical protein